MYGSHLSIAGGLNYALDEAAILKLNTVQVFTRNQQQWQAKPLEPDAIAAFRRQAESLHFKDMVAHDSYLINLASGDEALRQKSIASFSQELWRCSQLGIKYLVTHGGSHGGDGEEVGLARIANSLNKVLAQAPRDVVLCLETTAGQGASLGWRFEHWAQVIKAVDNAAGIGICLDTCHVLAAGYDITTRRGAEAMLKEFDRHIGLERLRVFHLNDSRRELGSRVDRHTHIGHGYVGLDAFAVIVRDERFNTTPKILETPKGVAPDGQAWDAVNLQVLKMLERGKRPALVALPKDSNVAKIALKKKAPSRGRKKSARKANKAGVKA
ncbi:MAG: deoxyribonuclease IV [Phycisphaerae bacterium]